MSLRNDERLAFEADRAERLAQHLREHPEQAGQDPKVLAADFELPVPFVRDVLRFLKAPALPQNYIRLAVIDAWSKLVNLYEVTSATLDSLQKRVLAWIALSSAVGIVLLAVVSPYPLERRGVQSVGLDLTAAGTAVLLLVFAFHGILIFRKAQVTTALQSTVIVSGITFAAVSGTLLRAYSFSLEDSLQFGFVAGMLAMTAYGLVVMTVAVLGAASKLHAHHGVEDNLSRQDLLDRLLHVRENLKLRDQLFVAPTAPRSRVPMWLERNIFSVTVAVVGTLGVLYRWGYSACQRLENDWASVLRIIVNPIFFLLLIALAFASGTIRRGVIVSILTATVLQITAALPFPPFGIEKFMQRIISGEFTLNIVGAIILGVIAGLAARVEDQAAQAHRKRENDSAALVAEWVRLHWRLSPERSVVTVMVVDARGSTAMKSEADPLIAEWSFREYQKFVARISESFGGGVHATSGDGAVIAFPAPNEAFAAARTIQREIDDFNRSVNRLKSPFRLRIGLHMGRVEGDLDEVEFTEVIDIAAHIEAAAPVGGIAMSKRVAEKLEGEKLAQIVTEGIQQEVLIALEPTGI